jgi:hypothetical protein
MTRIERQRELQVLSDAESSPKLGRYYSFKDDPELAATAKRLGMGPVPYMIDISESPTPGGPAVHLIGIREPGKRRLKALRAKLAAEPS